MLFTYGAVVDRGAGLVARRHRCFATRGQGELHTIERGVAVGVGGIAGHHGAGLDGRVVAGGINGVKLANTRADNGEIARRRAGVTRRESFCLLTQYKRINDYQPCDALKISLITSHQFQAVNQGCCRDNSIGQLDRIFRTQGDRLLNDSG